MSEVFAFSAIQLATQRVQRMLPAKPASRGQPQFLSELVPFTAIPIATLLHKHRFAITVVVIRLPSGTIPTLTGSGRR